MKVKKEAVKLEVEGEGLVKEEEVLAEVREIKAEDVTDDAVKIEETPRTLVKTEDVDRAIGDIEDIGRIPSRRTTRKRT